MPKKVIVYRGTRGMFRWRLVDTKGAMLEQSDVEKPYATFESAQHAGEKVAKENNAKLDLRRPEEDF